MKQKIVSGGKFNDEGGGEDDDKGIPLLVGRHIDAGKHSEGIFHKVKLGSGSRKPHNRGVQDRAP